MEKGILVVGIVDVAIPQCQMAQNLNWFHLVLYTFRITILYFSYVEPYLNDFGSLLSLHQSCPTVIKLQRAFPKAAEFKYQ